MRNKRANNFSNNYKRGNGGETLKKKLHIFSILLVLFPIASYFLVYIYKNNEMQSLNKRIKEVNKQIDIKTTDYKKIQSKIDRLVGFQEVKKYALNKLKMVDVEKEVEMFVVVDKNSIFIKKDSIKKQELFNNNDDKITMNR